MTLERKTAVVTGGARGIGLAFSHRLAADGANVVIFDLHGAEETATQLRGPGRHAARTVDVGLPDQLSDAARFVLDEYGRCDILVNNAGVFPFVDLAGVTLDLWHRVQAVNVEAMLLLAQAFAPGMHAAGWGRIVNTGSGITLTINRDLAYLTSKGTVHALTRALANELGGSGITVNALAPGLIATEGFLGRVRTDGPSADDIIARTAAAQSVPRPGATNDLAAALAFIASEDAAFITGQIVHVDGGVTRTGA